VLNEEEAIAKLLDEIHMEGFSNILVVDGYSTDKTVSIAESNGASVIKQHGIGKTGALRTALEHVKTPYLVVMDGDCTYSPGDIERFLPMASRYDLILGSRRTGRENISNVHRFGNWVINTAINILYGAGISDACTGMYLMNTRMANSIELSSKGFDVEVENIIKNIDAGNITEVPISYRERIGKTKLNTWRQGFQILWTVIRMAFSYNPVFFLSLLGSLLGLIGGGILGYELYLRYLFGESGWSIGYLWLGLILFIMGLNSFTVATITLIIKRQEKRISRLIRSLGR
jgi:dolichol-phosphate mannosyltransferase